MMARQSRNRKIVFGLMSAMIGGRLLVFALGIIGLIDWSPPLGASVLSWIIPVVMPLVMITAMLLMGRGGPMQHQQTVQGPDDMTISEILRRRLALGEITKDQYEEIKRILSQDKSREQEDGKT